jgi:hypothetical protein
MRGLAAWLISLPLAVAAWLAAHCLAYRLVAPGAEHHMGLHAETGHAYLGYTPALALWGLTLVVAGLVLCIAGGLRRQLAWRPPVRLFAVLPPAGFVVQEHIERLIGTGAIPTDLMAEPTFLVGLALQVPFAVVALLLTHTLRNVGFRLGRTVAGNLGMELGLVVQHQLPRPPAPVVVRAPCVLALGHGARAPPAPACS